MRRCWGQRPEVGCVRVHVLGGLNVAAGQLPVGGVLKAASVFGLQRERPLDMFWERGSKRGWQLRSNGVRLAPAKVWRGSGCFRVHRRVGRARLVPAKVWGLSSVFWSHWSVARVRLVPAKVWGFRKGFRPHWSAPWARLGPAKVWGWKRKLGLRLLPGHPAGGHCGGNIFVCCTCLRPWLPLPRNCRRRSPYCHIAPLFALMTCACLHMRGRTFKLNI